MDISNMCMKLYEIINQTEELSIASLVIDYDSADQLLIELTSGEKFRITIKETDDFV